MDEPMRAWPTGLPWAGGEPSVGVVVVNWNTRELLLRVLFGVLRVVAPGSVREVVVVDNGSDDGSVEMAAALSDAGVLHLVSNESQRYHGPGLTQGVNLLSTLADAVPVDLVWVLDSDVFVLRPEVVRDGAAALAGTGAVLVGERDDYRPGPAAITTERLASCSMLFDPAIVWQPSHSPFRQDGEPSRHLQADLLAAGHRLAVFPFCTERYLLHLGRRTLAAVAQRNDIDNEYAEWAQTHTAPHYGLLTDGAHLARAFEERFQSDMGSELTNRRLIEILASRE